MSEQTKLVVKTVEEIRPILKGLPVEVQGAVLAELTAMWLAGHWIPGEEEETKKLRARVYSYHAVHVARLIVENAKIMGTDK